MDDNHVDDNRRIDNDRCGNLPEIAGLHNRSHLLCHKEENI